MLVFSEKSHCVIQRSWNKFKVPNVYQSFEQIQQNNDLRILIVNTCYRFIKDE